MLNITARDIDHILDKAEASMYDNYHECLAQAQMASTHAQTNGDIRRYALALRYMAWAYYTLLDYEAALSVAMEGILLARDFELLDLEAYLINTIANVYTRCGIHKEAEHLYEYQISIGHQLNDPLIQAIALNDYAAQKIMLGEYFAAHEYLEEAAQLLPNMDYKGATIRQNLAQANFLIGLFDKAREHTAYVLEQCQAFPSICVQAHVTNAEACVALGDYQQAAKEIASGRTYVTEPAQLVAFVGLTLAEIRLLIAEEREHEVIPMLEAIYERAVAAHEYGYAVNVLNYVKQLYEKYNDTENIIRTYKRLTEDIPTQQQKIYELRIAVLKMVFARDKAILQSKIELEHQKVTILERLSHEFRTPLAIIQTSVDTLANYSDRLTLEDSQRRLKRVTSQVQWMTTMLDDILQLIGSDDHKTLLAVTSFRVEDMVQSVIASVDRYKQSDSSRIRVTIKSDRTHITAMQEAIKSLSVQLLTNALKYSKDDVLFNIDIDDNSLTIQVVDFGIGILPSEKELILQPLVRGTNLNEQAGTGIGLAIVTNLVEKMHAKMDLHSEVDKGTTATIHIPVPTTY